MEPTSWGLTGEETVSRDMFPTKEAADHWEEKQPERCTDTTGKQLEEGPVKGWPQPQPTTLEPLD